MNLIIAEDEPRLRNSLACNIPWEEYGIEVVGAVSNGVEALSMAERKMPDLMLLDVQMPEMDGLTLLGRLKERHNGRSGMKTIILSGHDSFDFARQAMEYGVSRYLLKPAGEEEILRAVLEARDELRRELEQWKMTSELEQRWKDNLPNLQNALIVNWAGGKYDSREVLKRGQELYMGLHSNLLLAAAVIEFDHIPEDNPRFGPNDRELLRFTIRCLAGELLPSSSCWTCTDPDADLLLVFREEPERDPQDWLLHVHTAVARLLSHTKEILKLTASAGICGRTGGISELPQLYGEARRALQERVVLGEDIAIPYREIPADLEQAGSGQPQLEKQLEIALETADEQKSLEAAQALWEMLFSSTASSRQFQEAVLYINSLLVRLIVKQGWSIHEVMQDDWMYFQNAELLNSRPQTSAWLAKTVKRMTDYMKSQRKSGSHRLIRQITEMIEREVDQEMTLHTVADRLYVNSSYLSRLFKQEMGMSFSAYVLERKMERAKRILQEGQKVYDAARETGYRDVSYFTKVFRKYWGVTPGEVKG